MTDTEIWNLRQHETVTRRTRKGRTVQEVTHRGTAVLKGALDRDVNGLPLLPAISADMIHPATAAAVQLLREVERGEIKARRFGLPALDVTRVTDAAYGDLIPALLSTEARQYEQVIHQDRSASASRGVTRHTCGIDGARTLPGSSFIDPLTLTYTPHPDGSHSVSAVWDSNLVDIAAQECANVPQTVSELKVWPTRGEQMPAKFGRLAYERRESDPRSRRVFRVASDGTCERVVEVVTRQENSERLWQGFRPIDRYPAIVRTTDQLADRTDLTAHDMPAAAPDMTRGQWEAFIARVEIDRRADAGDVTITRAAKDGRYSAVVRGARPMRFQSRTAATLADRLHAWLAS